MTRNRILIAVLVLVVTLAAGASWVRQLPAHSEEAKAHLDAVEGLMNDLGGSLPAVEPIIDIRSRTSVWANQKATAGKIAVSLDDVKEVLEQSARTQDTATKARASWVAANAEVKSRTAKLRAMFGDTIWPDQLSGLLRAWRDILVLISAPAVIAIVFAYLLHSKTAAERIAELAKSVHSVALPGGIGLTLWGDQFRKSQSDTFKQFRDDVQAEYDKLAEQHTIKDTVDRILKNTFEPALTDIGKSKVDYRATIHVRDALFKDSYYQLIDYRPTGGSKGRAWSVRFGMVGRAWRLEEDSWNGEVPKTSDGLIKDWGMTRDQTQHSPRQTMLCCILKTNAGTPVGAFYVDAQGKHEFGEDAQMRDLAAKIQCAAASTGLIQSLDAIWEAIKKRHRSWKSMGTVASSLGSYSQLAHEYYNSVRHPTCSNFRECSAAIFRAWFSQFLKFGMSIVETGSGASVAAEIVTESRLRISLLLTDSSHEMLKQSQNFAGVRRVIADAENLPVQNSSVDAIVASLGDPYNTASFWRECRRVLRVGGYVFFSTPSYSWASTYREETGSPASAAEFTLLDGAKVYVPSMVVSPQQQIEIISSAGFRVDDVVHVDSSVLLASKPSPKLRPGPLVSGYRAVLCGSQD